MIKPGDLVVSHIPIDGSLRNYWVTVATVVSVTEKRLHLKARDFPEALQVFRSEDSCIPIPKGASKEVEEFLVRIYDY